MFSFMRTGMAFMAVGIMEAAFEDRAGVRPRARDVRRTDRPAPAGSGEALRRSDGDRDLRGLSAAAPEALVDGDPDARLASLAKGTPANSRSTRPATRCRCWARRGVDLENRMERYYRDARVMTIPDGTTEIQKLIVGKELTE